MNNTLAHDGPLEDNMDFIRTLQTKDWMIAAVAFIAGAWIF